MKEEDVVYELECWVNRIGDKFEIHHTNNGGFPAVGQGIHPLYTHPAKLIIYKNGKQLSEEAGVKLPE